MHHVQYSLAMLHQHLKLYYSDATLQKLQHCSIMLNWLGITQLVKPSACTTLQPLNQEWMRSVTVHKALGENMAGLLISTAVAARTLPQ